MSTGCFFVTPFKIQPDIRPDTGYPARPEFRQNRLAGYPAIQYPVQPYKIGHYFLCSNNLYHFLRITAHPIIHSQIQLCIYIVQIRKKVGLLDLLC